MCLLGPHHNNYDGVASSVTSCLSVRLSVCPRVRLSAKCVRNFAWTNFGHIHSDWAKMQDWTAKTVNDNSRFLFLSFPSLSFLIPSFSRVCVSRCRFSCVFACSRAITWHHLRMTCESLGYHLRNIWESLENHLRINRKITWEPLKYHLRITLESH